MSKSKPIQNIDEKAIWDGIKQFARDPRGVSQFLKKDTMGRIGRTVADTVKGAFEPVDRVRAAQSMKTFYDSSKGGEKGIIDVRNPKFFALIKKYFAIGEELGGRFLQDVQSGRLAHSRVNSALNSIQSFFDFLKSRDSSNYQNIVSQWTMRDDANEFMRDPSIGIPINVRPRVLNELNLAFARAMRGGANKVMRAAGENWGGEAVTGAEGQFERISAGIDQFATELAERIGQLKERPFSEDEIKEINTKLGQAKITLKRVIDLASKTNDLRSIDTIKAAQEKSRKLEELESELGKYQVSPEDRNKFIAEIENYTEKAGNEITAISNYIQRIGAKMNDANTEVYKGKLDSIEEELKSYANTLNTYYRGGDIPLDIKTRVEQLVGAEQGPDEDHKIGGEIGVKLGWIVNLKRQLGEAIKSDSFKNEVATKIEAPLKELASKIASYKSNKNPAVKEYITSQLDNIRKEVSKLITKAIEQLPPKTPTEERKAKAKEIEAYYQQINELNAYFNLIEGSHNVDSLKVGLDVVEATIKNASTWLDRLRTNGYNADNANSFLRSYQAANSELSNIRTSVDSLPDESADKKVLNVSVNGLDDKIRQLYQDFTNLGADEKTGARVKEILPKITKLINELNAVGKDLNAYSRKLDSKDFLGNTSEDITQKLSTAIGLVAEAKDILESDEYLNDEALLNRIKKEWGRLNELVSIVSNLISSVETKRRTGKGGRDEMLVNYIDRLNNAKSTLDALKSQIRGAVERKSEDIDEYKDIYKVFLLNKNRLAKAKEFLSKEYPEWDEGENNKAEELGNVIPVIKQKIAEVEPLIKELYNIQFNTDVLERNYVELRNRLNKAKSDEELSAIRKEARNEMIRLLGLKRGLVKGQVSDASKANIESIRKELKNLRKEAQDKMGPDYTKIKVGVNTADNIKSKDGKKKSKKKNETFDNMISQLLRSAKILESAAPDALDNAINALDQNQPPVDPMQQPMDHQPTDPTMAGAEPPPEPTMDAQAEPQVEVSGLAPDADPRGVELDEPEHKSGEHSTRKVMSAVRKALETEVDQLAANIVRASKWPDKAAKKAIDITSDKSKRDILTKVKANLKGNMDKKLESILQECAILEKKMNKSKAKANAKAKKDTKKKADKKADKKPKKLKECVGSMAKYFESACVLDEAKAKAKDKKKKSGDSSKFIFGKSDKKKK